MDSHLFSTMDIHRKEAGICIFDNFLWLSAVLLDINVNNEFNLRGCIFYFSEAVHRGHRRLPGHVQRSEHHVTVLPVSCVHLVRGLQLVKIPNRLARNRHFRAEPSWERRFHRHQVRCSCGQRAQEEVQTQKGGIDPEKQDKRLYAQELGRATTRTKSRKDEEKAVF